MSPLTGSYRLGVVTDMSFCFLDSSKSARCESSHSPRSCHEFHFHESRFHHCQIQCQPLSTILTTRLFCLPCLSAYFGRAFKLIQNNLAGRVIILASIALTLCPYSVHVSNTVTCMSDCGPRPVQCQGRHKFPGNHCTAWPLTSPFALSLLYIYFLGCPIHDTRLRSTARSFVLTVK
ncbi:hypothetical protein EV702DRAFT_620714 [Suillus placidus]|uniref:Uncharacterized protein n=1 Tax=Suillus placidus TaxID=48579 RepID=A0A9P6ZMN7_9AGAM|nr:hypothetical protein EV702DRAFT_620714 [Suillus placidus]